MQIIEKFVIIIRKTKRMERERFSEEHWKRYLKFRSSERKMCQ